MSEKRYPDPADWSVTTWEGSRRELIERWSSMSFDEILEAQEEMADLAGELAEPGARAGAPSSATGAPPHAAEPKSSYGGSGTPSHEVALPGCTPEPLMAYLKALGILRLVSDQKDAEARGWWENDVFWLRSTLDCDALMKFFLEEYRPTPIVVPWSGGDFFAVKWKARLAKWNRTPTASHAIEAILATTTNRFEHYRKALHACKDALRACRIDAKQKMGKEKWVFIQTLRSSCEEHGVIEWMDAAAVDTVERFAPLLGSGGGSDGNTHFSDNFMQNLWDALPDFDDQRKGSPESVNGPSKELLNAALFDSCTGSLILKRTSSLYDSGAVGGPNASQGMERESLSNPWNVILALEGTVSFAGAATKRLATNTANQGAFPFQVSASVTVQDRLADKERRGSEVWLPLWTRSARCDEVLALLREGRAQCGPRPARTGVDMARSIASLGVDRGIGAFGRYAILKGRVGGENYNTAASLGRFYTAERSGVDLLCEVDSWLGAFRRAAGDKNAPPRFASVLGRIDSAIFEFCKYGGAPLFQEIVVALGAGERTLATAERFRDKEKLRPLAGLSPAWIGAADDGSTEFGVARALASIRDAEEKIGPFRANLDPVDWSKGCHRWAKKDRSVVWTAADFPTNLAGVLQRRLMDGARTGCEGLPLASHFSVPLDAVAAFIAGGLDDQRNEELIWGLMLIDERGSGSPRVPGTGAPPLPRAYALLKLLFLPQPLFIERNADGTSFARLPRHNEQAGVVIRPEPSILHLLRGGQLGEACAIAMRRLRASGLAPSPKPIRGRGVRDLEWKELDRSDRTDMDPRRLAAALLIPIHEGAVNRLVQLVVRADEMGD